TRAGVGSHGGWLRHPALGKRRRRRDCGGPRVHALARGEPVSSLAPSDETLPPQRRKPFSMIREFHLADWLTLANAVCGTGALFSMMSYLESTEVWHIYAACALVLAAGVFDVL